MNSPPGGVVTSGAGRVGSPGGGMKTSGGMLSTKSVSGASGCSSSMTRASTSITSACIASASKAFGSKPRALAPDAAGGTPAPRAPMRPMPPPSARWMAAVASARRPERVRRCTLSIRFRKLSFTAGPLLLLPMRLLDAVGQCRLDGRAGLEHAQHLHRIDGGAGELGTHVVADARKTEHMDLQLLAAGAQGLELGARVVVQAEHHGLARDRLLDDLGMDLQLIADRRADEVAAVRIEVLLHQQVDLPQVDRAEVDRDLLAVVAGPGFDGFEHLYTIHLPSMWMECGAVYLIICARRAQSGFSRPHACEQQGLLGLRRFRNKHPRAEAHERFVRPAVVDQRHGRTGAGVAVDDDLGLRDTTVALADAQRVGRVVETVSHAEALPVGGQARLDMQQRAVCAR